MYLKFPQLNHSVRGDKILGIEEPGISIVGRASLPAIDARARLRLFVFLER